MGIKVTSLTRGYGKVRVLEGLDMDVDRCSKIAQYAFVITLLH